MATKSQKLSIIGGGFTALMVTLSLLFPTLFAETFDLSLQQFQILFGVLFVAFFIWAIYVWRKKEPLVTPPTASPNRHDLRAHNKRLVEESLAKVRFVPDKLVTGQELELVEGGRPPFLEQLKSHLKSYPVIQTLLGELPRKWLTARSEDDDALLTIEGTIREKLESCVIMPQLLHVSSALADRVRTDIMQSSESMLVSVGYASQTTNGRTSVAYTDLTGYEMCVAGLVNRMNELAIDWNLKKKYSSIKKDYEEVRLGKGKFDEEKRAIIERARLTEYDTLDGDCSECRNLKGK